MQTGTMYPAFDYLDFLTQVERDIVWRSWAQEEESLLVLLRLSTAEIASGYYEDASVIDNCVAAVCCNAIDGALYLLRSKFENGAAERCGRRTGHVRVLEIFR